MKETGGKINEMIKIQYTPEKARAWNKMYDPSHSFSNWFA